MRGAILSAERENEFYFWRGGSRSQSAGVQTVLYCGATLKGPIVREARLWVVGERPQK